MSDKKAAWDAVHAAYKGTPIVSAVPKAKTILKLPTRKPRPAPIGAVEEPETEDMKIKRFWQKTSKDIAGGKLPVTKEGFDLPHPFDGSGRAFKFKAPPDAPIHGVRVLSGESSIYKENKKYYIEINTDDSGRNYTNVSIWCPSVPKIWEIPDDKLKQIIADILNK